MSIVLENVTLGYERRPAAHHLSGTFEDGRITAVMGPNGSGKSTLLKGLAGALTPLSGRIDCGGLTPQQVAYLPQESGINRGFPMTVGGLVSLGLMNRRGLFGGLRSADRAAIHDALHTVGLEGFEGRALDQVSGGQLQRALFARVIVQDARLVLLDEPFSALDERTTADLVHLIRAWPDQGRTVVMVVHNLAMARELCDDALLLAREAVAWGPVAEALSPAHLAQAQHLSEAWAQDAHDCHKDEAA